jgi:hypothetical protein
MQRVPVVVVRCAVIATRCHNPELSTPAASSLPRSSMFRYTPGAASARTSAFPGSLFGVSSSPAPFGEPDSPSRLDPGSPDHRVDLCHYRDNEEPCRLLEAAAEVRPPVLRHPGKEERASDCPLPRRTGWLFRPGHCHIPQRGVQPRLADVSQFPLSVPPADSRGVHRHQGPRFARTRALRSAERHRSENALLRVSLTKLAAPGPSLFRRVSRDSRPPCSSRARACGTPGDTAVATRSSAVLVATGTCEMTP